MTDLNHEEANFGIAEATEDAFTAWECAEITLESKYGKEWTRKHPECIGQLVIATATLLAAREPR